jgi:hypothetical protein
LPRKQEHRKQRRTDCWAFGCGVGVYSRFLLRRVFLWFCCVSAFSSAVRCRSGSHVCPLHAGFEFFHLCVLPRLLCCLPSSGLLSTTQRWLLNSRPGKHGRWWPCCVRCISAVPRFSHGPRTSHAHHGGAARPPEIVFPEVQSYRSLRLPLLGGMGRGAAACSQSSDRGCCGPGSCVVLAHLTTTSHLFCSFLSSSLGARNRARPSLECSMSNKDVSRRYHFTVWWLV